MGPVDDSLWGTKFLPQGRVGADLQPSPVLRPMEHLLRNEPVEGDFELYSKSRLPDRPNFLASL